MSLSLVRRRELRRNGTSSEIVLWRQLRDRRFERFKFRRQYPCGPYIIDFYCARMRLAIELDGGQHYEPATQAYDERRTAYLRRRRIVVLRFPTDVVFRELDGVLECIAAALSGGPSP